MTSQNAEQDAERRNASIDLGWGRLIFGQTFSSQAELAEALSRERPDRRDIAFYVEEPHTLLAEAPQELFLDPSHAYRLDLSAYAPSERAPLGFRIRTMSAPGDGEAVNAIYAARGMAVAPPEYFWSGRDRGAVEIFLAEDETGEILGAVTGVDHVAAFGCREKGCSLWSLAVSPTAVRPGVGRALARGLIEHFRDRGARRLDLSVMHDNAEAIALYEKLGFARVPAFAVKRKNPINEPLFIGPDPADALNIYAKIIIDEARRRGVQVQIIDAARNLFELSYGGRRVRCLESLSDFTSAVALAICDDKAATRRVVESAGVRAPAQIEAGAPDAIAAFLAEHGEVVVKPAQGEQGRGVAVGLRTEDEVQSAIAAAREVGQRVLVEECESGDDLRLVVIDFKVVAAAVRRPPRVVGDGRKTVRALIEAQSRRREAATGGESRIPIDAETERCVAAAGRSLDEIAPEGETITVRRTANLHTGGVIHDVTDETHPALIDAAVRVARAIDIPVVGVDLMVKNPRFPEYAFIEANERPGLANHEPHPTAERFLDLLFPLSMPSAAREAAPWRPRYEDAPARAVGGDDR